MKLVIQRVLEAGVVIEGKEVASIGRGLLVLVGVEDKDQEQTAEKYFQKLIKLRIFEDAQGKTNLSIKDVGGSLLLVSQFTLMASCRDGNRPSFIGAGKPERAKALYEYMVQLGKATEIPTEQGEFGADMKVRLVNDGPFTIILENL